MCVHIVKGENNSKYVNKYCLGNLFSNLSQVLVSVKGISHLRHSFAEPDQRLMEMYAQLLVPAQVIHSVLSKTTLRVEINSEMVEVLN